MQFDIVIIGTGIGGSTMAKQLAATGKKIAILERGGFIPLEKENWDPVEVVEKGRYRPRESWYDENQQPFSPFTHYAVGGNSKVYGAALFRLRERDFTEYETPAGTSPAWPLSYTDFKPYYDQAERFLHVHGQRGADPFEPPTSNDYPFPPLPIEPFTELLYGHVRQAGVQAFPIPIGVRLTRDGSMPDAELVLGNFDGFPDPTERKADGHILGIRPALQYPNVTLYTHAYVSRLDTDVSGQNVVSAQVVIEGETVEFKADIFIIGAGAINSAALLLRSVSSLHPNGLANSNGLVGRNYMSHINGCLIAYTPYKLNDAAFQKYFAIGDYYWGDADYPYPMGEIQLMGKNDPATYLYNPPPVFKDKSAEYIAQHAIDFWITAEDVPKYDNAVKLMPDGAIQLVYDRASNNVQSFEELKGRLKTIMAKVGKIDSAFANLIWGGYDLGISGVSHQCGTLRFGADSASSVLNPDCRSHEIQNLYVIDGSFFPSSGAYNPALTIAANAIRVSDIIKSLL